MSGRVALVGLDPSVTLVANSRPRLPSRSLRWMGGPARSIPRVLDASAEFATSVTVGSTPITLGSTLHAPFVTLLADGLRRFPSKTAEIVLPEPLDSRLLTAGRGPPSPGVEFKRRGGCRSIFLRNMMLIDLAMCPYLPHNQVYVSRILGTHPEYAKERLLKAAQSHQAHEMLDEFVDVVAPFKKVNAERSLTLS